MVQLATSHVAREGSGECRLLVGMKCGQRGLDVAARSGPSTASSHDLLQPNRHIISARGAHWLFKVVRQAVERRGEPVEEEEFCDHLCLVVDMVVLPGGRIAIAQDVPNGVHPGVAARADSRECLNRSV